MQKNIQAFIRGAILFVSMLLLEYPFVWYLQKTGVELTPGVQTWILTGFAFIALLATAAWR